MLQRTLPAGFISPCLPTRTNKLPSGSEWLHEIKHDGFRVIARKKGAQVMLYSRPGNDLTYRSLPADRRDVDAPASHGPASSTARQLPVMTTASLYSIVSATAAMTRPFSCTSLT